MDLEKINSVGHHCPHEVRENTSTTNSDENPNWDELVTRNMNMHIKKFPQLEQDIRDVYQMVFQKKVLPSMRSMQFGGKLLEVSPNRIFNCAYCPIDDPRVFGEIAFSSRRNRCWIFRSRTPC